GEGLQVDERDRRGDGLAGEDDRDLDLDLLALADGDQVEVVQAALERVALDLLDQRQVLGAVGERELEQRVGVAGGQGGVVARQREVEGGLAVSVQDGGDAVLGAEAAGRALAEVLAQLDVQLLSHGGAPRGCGGSTVSDATGHREALLPRSAPRRSRRGSLPAPSPK